MNAQACVKTATLYGVEAVPVDVEVDVGSGLPSFSIVGLPDAAVQEARERVRSALRASGYELPNSRIVVNLAPGPLRKHGTGFDLPIALGLLSATKQLSPRTLEGITAVGELSLDGGVRPVPGLIAHALSARGQGLTLLGPVSDSGAAGLSGARYLGLSRLSELTQGLPDAVHPAAWATVQDNNVDFSEVAGQGMAVRALTVAAAGGHNLLMLGPPGSGKTMLARRLTTILPPLDDHERLESALVHSVAGLDASAALAGLRSFRAPHHSASIAGIIGGGTPARPGEASLAHHGVLFLDEMAEFGPAALQSLRQPMEDGRVVLVRAEGRLTFPSRFSLIGASNPCPCGYFGDSERACTCGAAVVDRYRARIGGPLMDRIDLVIDVNRPKTSRLLVPHTGESSHSLRERVLEARARRTHRGHGSSLSGGDLLGACRLDNQARKAVEAAARKHLLSGRGVTRLLRVSRTLADLDGSESVTCDQLGEALAFRSSTRL